MKDKQYTTRWISYTAMMTALVIASGFIPPVEIPPIGRIYWCDGVIFLACFLFEPLSATIIGGLGTFVYDLIVGSAYMMFVSLVIHGLQAFAVSFLLHKVFPKKKEPLFAFVASLAGAAIVTAGYFITRTLIQNKEISYALIRMPANLIQEAVGIAIALLVCYALRLKPALVKNNLLPQTRTAEPPVFPTENNEISQDEK